MLKQISKQLEKIKRLYEPTDKAFNEIFKLLKGQKIRELKVKQNADQYFLLNTEDYKIKIGANDLGVWIQSFEENKKEGYKWKI